MSTTLACPPPSAAPWPSASVRQQALQRTAHWALLGRLAVGSAQERSSCGTPREQSGEQTRRYARGTRHHGVLAPGEMRGLVPTTVTGYRHLAPCRHRLLGQAAAPTPAPSVASPAAGHGAPPRCGASDAVPPAVLPRGTWWSAARHAALVLGTRRPPGWASRWRAAAAGEGSRWCGFWG